jgi:uncharacterized membrane protein YeaQ/YmgE (transglycosylase-associated protein family)
MADFIGIGLIGWIIVGFLAGALSGLVVRNRAAGGCLGNIVIGVIGGILGGYLVNVVLNQGQVYGWVGAFVVAFIGAVIVRWLLGLFGPRDRNY